MRHSTPAPFLHLDSFDSLDSFGTRPTQRARPSPLPRPSVHTHRTTAAPAPHPATDIPPCQRHTPSTHPTPQPESQPPPTPEHKPTRTPLKLPIAFTGRAAANPDPPTHPKHPPHHQTPTPATDQTPSHPHPLPHPPTHHRQAASAPAPAPPTANRHQPQPSLPATTAAATALLCRTIATLAARHQGLTRTSHPTASQPQPRASERASATTRPSPHLLAATASTPAATQGAPVAEGAQTTRATPHTRRAGNERGHRAARAPAGSRLLAPRCHRRHASPRPNAQTCAVGRHLCPWRVCCSLSPRRGTGCTDAGSIVYGAVPHVGSGQLLTTTLARLNPTRPWTGPSLQQAGEFGSSRRRRGDSR